MEILYLLIPMGVVLMAIAGAVLIWALHDGQYDELDEIAQRMPDDDAAPLAVDPGQRQPRG